MQTSAHPSPPTVVLIAPQGTGKTQNAQVIADAFGCTQIVDDWNGLDPLPKGALALTNADFAAAPRGAVELAADDAGGVARIVAALTRYA